MKKEKPAPDTKEPKDQQATGTGAAAKKKKKNKQDDETLPAAPKVKKAKPDKGGKEAAEKKEQKALKKDKSTKFLVRMKKSVRKSIKKDAAEVGVSMNDYIVVAVEEKLNKVPPVRSKAALKKP